MLTAVLALGLMLSPSPTFPDRLLGQWTDDPANCGQEDTTGVRITPTAVQFYEATGTPTRLTQEGEILLLADMAYEGEGRRWTEVNSFELSRDGSSIRVRALGQLMVLEKCEAGQD
ncbi:MAG: hypothetical protein REJ23_13755 [Brevundimonas sp.]|nr:hypothetical protein [Brevundimonas sp.]